MTEYPVALTVAVEDVGCTTAVEIRVNGVPAVAWLPGTRHEDTAAGCALDAVRLLVRHLADLAGGGHGGRETYAGSIEEIRQQREAGW